MKIIYLSENNLISLHVMLVIILANMFLMFFNIFINISRNNFDIINNDNINNDNILVTYKITFNNLYKRVFSDNFPYDERCSICLEDFNLNNLNVVKTENCHHPFHETCLKQWLRIKATCPNCNINIVSKYINNIL